MSRHCPRSNIRVEDYFGSVFVLRWRKGRGEYRRADRTAWLYNSPRDTSLQSWLDRLSANGWRRV